MPTSEPGSAEVKAAGRRSAAAAKAVYAAFNKGSKRAPLATASGGSKIVAVSKPVALPAPRGGSEGAPAPAKVAKPAVLPAQSSSSKMAAAFANASKFSGVAAESTHVKLAVVPRATLDKRGKNLSAEVHWTLSSQTFLWQVLRRWAVDVLQIPEGKLPGGASGGAAQLAAKGVAALGRDGPLDLEARLADIVAKLPIKGGHRQLAVTWPKAALPADWRRRLDRPPKTSTGGSSCGECGEVLEFRKSRTDDGMRTLAVCVGCDAVRGSMMCKPRGRSRSRGR